MRRSERIDENSLSYIRGRYGPDSKEYKDARQGKYKAKVDAPDPKTITPNPGETPLQFARRRREQLKKES